MTAILQHPYAQALALALVHFLWQGALVGVASVVLLRFAGLSARARHSVGIALLGVMLAVPAATTMYFAAQTPRIGPTIETTTQLTTAPAQAADSATLSSELTTPAPSATTTITPAAVLGVWLTGVAILSVRLIGGWFVARRLTRSAVRTASAEIQSLAKRVAGRLALDRVVAVVESSTAAVPMMVGWIKPVVILPTAALAGLTPQQVEALLAHELAHVFRHDYLVNLLQSVVETALFYHPAVWWTSRQVRAAREQCCDDLAVDVCDRVVYATALAELAAMNTTPRLALAAADGSLVDRVRRILTGPAPERGGRSGWIPVAFLASVVAIAAPAAWSSPARAAGDQGVATGVKAGVNTGTSGGVQSGVDGGVNGGVSGGVDVGIAGGAPSAPQPSQQSAEEALAMRRQIEELTARYQELSKLYSERLAQKERGQLDQSNVAELEALRASLKDLELRLQAARQDSVAPLFLERQLEEAQAATKRTQELRDKNLVTEQQLAQAKLIEERLQLTLDAARADSTQRRDELKLQLAQVELTDAQRQLERSKTLLSKGLIATEEVAKAERALRDTEMRLQESKVTSQANASAEAAAVFDMKVREVEQEVERSRKLVQAGRMNEADLKRLELVLQDLQTLQAKRSGSMETLLRKQDAPMAFLGGRLEMLKQLTARAEQTMANANTMVQIGTLAGVDLASEEAVLQKIREARATLERAPSTSVPAASLDETRAKFSALMKALDYEQTRFSVGTTTLRALADLQLQALGVITGQGSGVSYAKVPSTAIEAPRDVPSSEANALVRRVLPANTAMTEGDLAGVIRDAARLSSESDRADVLLTIARQQALTPDLVTLFVSTAKGIKSESERARVFAQPIKLRGGLVAR